MKFNMKIRKFKEYSSINERKEELKKNGMIPLSEEEVKERYPNGVKMGLKLDIDSSKKIYRL